MKRWLIAVLVTLFVGVTGVAVASIPAADGTINGCYSDATGALRVIDSEDTCPNGTTPLNWNQTGPAGGQGPAGVSGLRTVFASYPVVIGGGSQIAVEVYCPDWENGERAIGGGAQAPGIQGDVWVLSRSTPIPFQDEPIGWSAQAERISGSSTTVGSISVRANCAYVEE
jgi:hypothetical protein